MRRFSGDFPRTARQAEKYRLRLFRNDRKLGGRKRKSDAREGKRERAGRTNGPPAVRFYRRNRKDF